MGETTRAPERATNRRTWIWVMAAAVTAWGLWMMLRPDDSDRGEAGDIATGLVTIEFRLVGSATWADVTIETPNGTEQFSPDIPMKRKTGEPGLELQFEEGDFVYISAQNNEATGDITCSIFASDGAVIARNTTSAAYGVVTCEGTAR
jgi:hypothetical protein